MNLSARDKRALTILTVAVVVFLLVDFGLLPLVDRFAEARQTLAVRELALRKYRRSAASEAARQSSLSELQKRLATTEAAMLESQTAALAAAELQRTLKEVAAANQIELSGTEFLPAKPLDSEHTLISTRFAVSANMERLVNFLVALETGPKSLGVRSLTVYANTGNPEKKVNATLVLSGVMRAEKAPEKGKEKG